MYNSENAMESIGLLPPDTIVDAVIVYKQDGKVKDFIKDTNKWNGDIDQPAINFRVEVKYNEKNYDFSQLFTYREEEGKTVYGSNSNLGRFKKKYGRLPDVNVKCKAISDSDGFLRIKLD